MPASVNILLVEDNPGDVRLAQETLKDYKMQNALHVVNDGEQALAYLWREPPYQAAPKPDMILLDIHLPKIDGLEVLAEMQKDENLRDIPIVILTSSRMDQEVLSRYRIPTDCYVIKPLTLERFLEAVRCFGHLGLSIVKLATA